MLKRVTKGWFYAFVLSFLLFTSLAPALLAQTAGTGALIGTVTDSTGAVVPNAVVTATGENGVARTATTGADGVYKFNLLPPGNYQVKFEAAGFNSVEVPAATVNVTETEVLNRALAVGAQNQEITVQADVETVQTATSALGTVVGTETVTELPLNTRNYTNLLAMSAGANAAVSNATSLGKASTLIAVNGAGFGQNNYLQDGVSLSNWYSFNTGTEGAAFGAMPIPNPDTIQEFKIQTSTYDAGYGRNPGANVNVVTKSGTNDFHGTAFEFFRNTALNANDWFNKYNEATHIDPNTKALAPLPNKQGVLNQNQFGGVFGGPVKKDKLFFFVSYQETQQTNGITGYGFSTVTLPSLPTGNRGTCPVSFSTTGNLASCDANAQAYVPKLAAAVCANNKPVAAGSIAVQGPAGSGCAAQTNALYNINPVAILLLQGQLANGGYMIPSVGPGNGASTFATFSDPATFKDHQGLGNFDYVLNSKNTLSGRYVYEIDPLNGNFAVLNATLPGNSLPGNPITTTKIDHGAILKLTSIVTPNFVNEARISYQRYVTNDTEGSPFRNSQFGIADLSPGTSPIADDLSTFTLTSLFQFGANYTFGLYLPENQMELADQVSWTHGKHAIRAGYEYERIQADQTYPSESIGAPTFQSFGDFLIGRAGACGAASLTCNSGTASNIQNVGNSTVVNSQFPYMFRATDMNLFVQDDYKVNSRLTLNLGVRWEYDGNLSEKYGNFTNFWPSLYNAAPIPGTTAATGSLVGYVVPSNYAGPLPAGVYKNSNQSSLPSHMPYDNFAPRVGFAWQPTSSSRWVIRGGGGYFYELITGVSLGQGLARTGPGSGAPTSGQSGTLQNPWVPATGLVPGPVGGLGFAPRYLNFTATPNVSVSSSNLEPFAIGTNLTTPLVYQWNLNTQYEFLPTWVLELGYVGSHGIHQLSQSQAGAQGQAGYIPYNWASLASPSNPINGITQNTIGNVSGRVPYLGITPTAAGIITGADYKYDSLQATVRKQLSHGLQLQAAYTWSRAFISQPYGINTAPYVIMQYGLNGNYRPQRLIVNYTWNIPVGHPGGLEGKLIQGWNLSGVTTVQDGTPLTITDTRGGTIFYGPGSTSNISIPTGQFAAGQTNANIPTSGTLQQRVLNGLAGGTGYLNGVAQGVFTTTPVIGNGTGFGNSGLDVVLGPGQSNWDMALAKTTVTGGIREGATVQFRAEFFNTFNHPQFANPAINLGSPSSYGHITAATVSPRVLQFALKYSF
jgi:hypothetical protein